MSTLHRFFLDLPRATQRALTRNRRGMRYHHLDGDVMRSAGRLGVRVTEDHAKYGPQDMGRHISDHEDPPPAWCPLRYGNGKV